LLIVVSKDRYDEMLGGEAEGGDRKSSKAEG
jgi:hypothetical protein